MSTTVIRTDTDPVRGVSREAGTPERTADTGAPMLHERVHAVARKQSPLTSASRVENEDVTFIAERLPYGGPLLLVTTNPTTPSLHDPDLPEAGMHSLSTEEEQQTLLFDALSWGCKGTVRFLIEHGVDTTRHNREGRSPLTKASCYGYTDIASSLLGAGASVHQEDKTGETPLEAAVRGGNSKMVRLLLEAGAKPEDGKGQALAIAAERGDTEIALCLLEAGADVNRRDGMGHTPLGQAVRTKPNNREMVHLLLEHGADPELVDGNGWSPLVAVTLSGDMSTALLLEFGIRDGFGTDGRCADEEYRTKLCEERIREKVGKTVHTLLMQALRQGDKIGVYRLLAERDFGRFVDRNEARQIFLSDTAQQKDAELARALRTYVKLIESASSR
ncbi:MAG: ankyrin repeat domain-containing protein [Simkaniaceae bacterium]|nr:ankyrin repeat domain-containing protein [Simkaniaceae bacterium]